MIVLALTNIPYIYVHASAALEEPKGGILIRMIRIILGIVLLLGVAGCDNDQRNAITANPTPVQEIGLQPQNVERTADEVVVSRSLGFGRVNPARYGIFTEKEQVDVFTKAIQSAEQIPGVLDVVQPDYDIIIEQGSKQVEIHLWLDARTEYGMYTYVSNTGIGYRLAPESMHGLYNLIWGIRYESKQAAANGDFVNLLGRTINLDKWKQFVRNMNAGIKDQIQVVRYTVEGGAIFDNLSFDGEMISRKYDNTHDSYGTPTKRYDFCKSIEEQKTERGTVYKLTSCGEGYAKEGAFSLLIP